ncbi:MAG: PilN domain-containing protein [Melioribacteraceae bacterium]|nr:PilN domain-containing protein [Melioribacteraceae bacterium]MCF8395084.1 PilN domain-containing protein [Melioribacteraceae bacterium]MCF8420369.1 PilN domain-containing protein [Melioribacteraceae bacterium]
MKITNDKLRDLPASLRFSGISKFLFLDFDSDKICIDAVKLNGMFSNISTVISSPKVRILKSAVLKNSGDENELIKSAEDFINEINFQNCYVIAAAKDYRIKYLQIPAELDDLDSWLEINTDKIFPNGGWLNDFNYFPVHLATQNDYREHLIVYSRKESVVYIENFIHKLPVNILSIIPFSLLTFIEHNKSLEKEKLLLHLDSSKLTGFLKGDKELQIFEHYSTSRTYSLHTVIENQIKNEIDSIALSDVYISHNFSDEDFKKNINCESLPPEIHIHITDKLKLFAAGLKLQFNGTLKRNLMNGENTERTDEILEKSFVEKCFFSLGAVTIFFLIILYLGEVIIQNNKISFEDSLAAVSAKEAAIEKISSENNNLRDDLIRLSRIKANSKHYPNIFHLLSNIISSNAVLNSLELTRSESIKKIVLNGYSRDQNEIAITVRNFERENKFRNTVLIYSKPVDSSSNQYGYPVRFSIRSEYVFLK